jgi:large subunit ribosomal protein L31
MKTDRHPPYAQADITCTCGVTYPTRSTTPNLRVAVCSNCHPFYTGRQRVVDPAGRMKAFQRKYGKERHTP